MGIIRPTAGIKVNLTLFYGPSCSEKSYKLSLIECDQMRPV